MSLNDLVPITLAIRHRKWHVSGLSTTAAPDDGHNWHVYKGLKHVPDAESPRDMRKLLTAVRKANAQDSEYMIAMLRDDNGELLPGLLRNSVCPISKRPVERRRFEICTIARGSSSPGFALCVEAGQTEAPQLAQVLHDHAGSDWIEPPPPPPAPPPESAEDRLERLRREHRDSLRLKIAHALANRPLLGEHGQAEAILAAIEDGNPSDEALLERDHARQLAAAPKMTNPPAPSQPPVMSKTEELGLFLRGISDTARTGYEAHAGTS